MKGSAGVGMLVWGKKGGIMVAAVPSTLHNTMMAAAARAVMAVARMVERPLG